MVGEHYQGNRTGASLSLSSGRLVPISRMTGSKVPMSLCSSKDQRRFGVENEGQTRENEGERDEEEPHLTPLTAQNSPLRSSVTCEPTNASSDAAATAGSTAPPESQYASYPTFLVMSVRMKLG